MNTKNRNVVALDVGSAKVVAIVAQAGETDVRCLTLAAVESKGMRKGQVANLDHVSQAIRQAVDLAEKQAGVPLESAIVGVGGGQVAGINSRGGLGLGNRPRDVTRDDVRRAVDAARQVRLPDGAEVLHVLPQGFWLDAQNGIRDPIGMVGRRLDVNVHLVTSPAVLAQNVVAAVNRAGVLVTDLVLEPLAAAETALTQDERELGACLVDIGAGTTELIVYAAGAVRHTSAIAIGGEHFTNDLAVGLRTPVVEADRIKREEVWSDAELQGQERRIEIPNVGERPPRSVSAREVADVLEARAQELLHLIRRELDRAGLASAIPAGLVFVGGGARLQGLLEMAEKTFALPARVGRPRGIEGLPEEAETPEFAASVGLALYGARAQEAQAVEQRPSLTTRLMGVFLS
ncbi:MAG TPA: cell division protein FtsA [Candidatus Acidoferrales bacterium]|nr:cell division protein FtsA [Candidatus Acidoferrales bacterium]